MKTPEWLAAAVAENGALVLGAEKTRTEAEAAGIAAVREHPEFLEQLGAALFARLLGKWIGEHAASGDLFQTQMFPDLPAVMRVAPSRRAAVADMTAEDLDHAKNMLYARTGNAVKGAQEAADRERRAFDALYDKVRPLLKGDMTVGEALGALATHPDARAGAA